MNDEIIVSKRLGKKLAVGRLFLSCSKKLHKGQLREHWYNQRARLYRNGEKDFFINGKRRYYCEVLGIAETRTGLHCWDTAFLQGHYKGPRWWQFVYVVKVLEN